MRASVVVIGAGAAGLWAAARAARLGAEVLLVEKTSRTGTKVLASGGTHCNLTTTLGAAGAARLFGPRAERFLRHAFRTLSPQDLREHFAALGVPTVEAPLEKVFPASGRARDVRDALEREARAAGVRIGCDSPVRSIEPTDGGWCVRIANGPLVQCAKLLVCPGGQSYPRTGTTGDGYAWLRALDLPVVEPVPALVPLASDERWVRELTGVALQDVEATLRDPDGRVLGRRRRPVVFTHQGVSGPGAMDLSVHVARTPGSHVLALDLFPDVSHDALRARCLEAAAKKGAPPVRHALPDVVPRRLFAEAARLAGLRSDEPRGNDLSKSERHRLVETLKALPVPISGTLGFDKAEVTAGGLALDAVDAGTMRVKGHEGLYAFGEILDVDGPIGGLNFQAAFATAELAARDAAGGRR